MGEVKQDEVRTAVGRRSFLKGTVAAAVSGLGGGLGAPAWAALQGSGAQEQALPSGLIVRMAEPKNLEFPFSTLDSFITPNDKFYVRNHFAMPSLNKSSWRLRVEGAVERPLEISFEELLRLPSQTQVVTMECAGNGRSLLNPAVRGVQWATGAVSTAEWTGVALATLLRKAGVKPGAVDVILEGADQGEIKAPPKPVGSIHFARSLPLSLALRPDVLLAYRMNDQELPPEHGHPLRAVVPGWYGMASIKWLTRIVVTDQPYNGFFQTVDYAYWVQDKSGLPTRIPLAEMDVKSLIAQPTADAKVRANSVQRVHGAAWTGDAEIRKVEVSTDGGKTWNDARLKGSSIRNAWRLWEYVWNVPSQTGQHVLMARATDSRGRVQPLRRDDNRDNYMITHVIPVPVTVVNG